MRRATRIALLLVCMSFVATDPAVAAEKAFDWVPKDAFGFAAIRNYSLMKTPFKTWALSNNREAFYLSCMIKEYFLLNKGLDKKRAAMLIMMSGDRKPTFFLLIPTTDYDLLINPLKPEKLSETVSVIPIGESRWLAAKKDDYAVIVNHGDRKLLDSMLEGRGPTMDLDAWKPWMAKSDAFGVIARAELEAVYYFPSNLKSISPTAEEPFGMIENMPYRSFNMQAKKEITAIAWRLAVEADGALCITVHSRCVDGSKLVEKLRSAKPLPKDALANLVGEDYAFIGAGWTPWLKTGADSMPLDVAKSRPMVKRIIQMERMIQGGCILYAVPRVADRPSEGWLNVVIWTSDADKLVDDYAAILAMANEQPEGNKARTKKKVTVEPTTIDGCKALIITATTKKTAKSASLSEGTDEKAQSQTEEETREQIAQKAKQVSKQVIYLVAADKTHVVYTYGDADQTRKMVAAIKNPKQKSFFTDASLAETSDKLPSDARWIGYINIKNAFRSILSMDSSPLGPNMTKLTKDFDIPPVGLAATAVDDGYEVHIYVPAAALKAFDLYWENQATIFKNY